MKAGRKATHTPVVLAVLEEAAGQPVDVDAISRRVWGAKAPREHRASVRCMVQRIRHNHRDRLTIEAVPVAAYRLVMRGAR